MKNQNYLKPQRTEGVQPLSAIDSKINKKFSQSDWAHNAEDWLTRQEGWEDSKPSSQQAIGAHILRIEKLTRQSTEGLTDSEKEKVEARNSRNKERLKKALIDKIVVRSEKALESELATLHGMYGHNLSDNEVIESFLNNQREKLGKWIDYLDGGNGAELYPTWFKIYVMNGVENMGRYNAEKGMYEKRSSGTVAEFPDLNPAALAKTFDVVNDFYVKNNKPKEQKELELFNSGSFNRIYSKIKSETIFSIKVPEWFDDIKGSWKEYTPGMAKDLTLAAQGTPWCIEGSYMAEQYLGREGGKFYLFHLEDPETGALSETAVASIRMEFDEVAELSGIRDASEQNIDISLLPTMIEKLNQLPGGKYFSDILSGDLELIENLPENAKCYGLKEALTEIYYKINEKVHFDAGNIIINNLDELKKDFTIDEIIADAPVRSLEPYIKAGFTAQEVFEKVNSCDLDSFNALVKAGFDKLEVFEKVKCGVSVDMWDFKSYIEAGIPPEKVFEKVEYVDEYNFNLFVEAGIPPEKVFEKVEYVDEDIFNSCIEAGIPPEKVFEKVECVSSNDIDFYIEKGVPRDIVLERRG